MSSVDQSLDAPLVPFFKPLPDSAEEASAIKNLIRVLTMSLHVEGGYFVETDRDTRRVPNPFVADRSTETNDTTRSASTTIFYLITPARSLGVFHRNKARTVHTLHQGRGRYVIVHADEAKDGRKARVETFVVGHDLAKGERLQWIVEGGKFKASFLLPDTPKSDGSDGLLISETVVPGFEYTDHDFMPPEMLPQIVSEEQSRELSWLLRRQQ